jgi:beta-barrel assembly-enhancing protease
MRSVTAAAVALALIPCLLPAQSNKKNDPRQIGNRNVGKGINLYSIDKEIALGRQLAQEVERQTKILDDPIITEYVNRLGQNLVRHSDAKVPFTFKVIDDPAVNAFALPGGFVFVNTGLIKIAAEESELAGAMGHEIAHVAARHMTRQATKSQLANLLTLPLGAVVGGWTGYAVKQGLGVGIPTLFLSFSRDAEVEADFLGVQYLYAAGYDPNGAISMFEKMESLRRKEPGKIARVFSTHPMDSERIDKTQQEIQTILEPKGEYVVTTSEYREMRERLIARELQREPARIPQLRERR